MENKLSIAIPTYNRKDDLIRLLKSIENTNFSLLKEIIISDNHSNYDVYDVISRNLSKDFVSKCRIIINNVNIGGPGNIRNLFLYCKTKWFWIIGDDDEVTSNSVDIIYNDINQDPSCAYFRYSIEYCLDKHTIKEYREYDVKMTSIHDFMSYYDDKTRSKGNMVFMSNNVYNMEILEPYFQYAFTYSTSLTQLIPAFMGLDSNKIYIRYRSKIICRYNEPETNNHWNYIRVLLAVSTMRHIPFKSLDKNGINKLMKCLCFINLKIFCSWVIQNKNKITRLEHVNIIYNSLFKRNSNFIDKILHLLLIIELKFDVNILTYIRKFRHSDK